MRNRMRQFFEQGAIRIPKDKERAIYFYATVIFFLVYLIHRLQGGG